MPNRRRVLPTGDWWDALRTKAEAESLGGNGLRAHQSFDEAFREAQRLGVSTEALDLGLLECESRDPSPIATYDVGGQARAMSADGRTLVATSPDYNSFQLWDVITGTKRGSIAVSAKNLNWVEFSPSGKLLAVTSGGELVIWSLSESKLLRRLTLDDTSINAAAFSPDDGQVAVATDHSQVKLVDLATGSEVKNFEAHAGKGTSVSYTPDGKLLLGGAGPESESQSIRVWDAKSGKEQHAIRTASKSPVYLGIAVDSSGTHAVAYDWFGLVTLFEPQTGKVLATTQMNAVPSDMAYSVDGRSLVAIHANGAVSLLQPDSLDTITKFQAHEGKACAGGWTSAGGICWTAGSADHLVKLWNTSAHPPMRDDVHNRRRSGRLRPIAQWRLSRSLTHG